ncbi:hypothetical protein SO802_031469 [Lithocarpus litseifolius]|uniref:Uncharacterized protein n=1 Tax=Lithocarpus litseifolius TaxID=425828 RepID=A0AAW2BM17_9ROSI
MKFFELRVCRHGSICFVNLFAYAPSQEKKITIKKEKEKEGRKRMCKNKATLFYNSFGPSLSSISNNTHILCQFHQLFLRCHDNELAIGVIDTVITELSGAFCQQIVLEF